MVHQCRSQLFSAFLTQFKYVICPVSDLDCELPEYFIDRAYKFYVPEVMSLPLSPFASAIESVESTGWLNVVECTIVQKPIIQAHAFALAMFASLVAPRRHNTIHFV